MTKSELLNICADRGVEGVSGNAIKADIINAILAEQEERENADA